MEQKAKSCGVKNFFKAPIAVVLVLILLIGITLGITIMRKTILVIIDAKEQKIVTYRSDLKEILSDNSIRIGEKDKINFKLDNKVKDGDKIYIKRAVNVKLNVDGKNLAIKTTENTVEDVLKKEGIKLNSEDRLVPSKTEKISSGLNITITRVTSKILKENKDISFSVVTKKDDSLPKGQKKVIRKGEKGQKVISTKVVYEDGKPVTKKVVSEAVSKKPVTQIVALGTLGVVRPSRGLNPVTYKHALKVKATAYTASVSCTGKGVGDPGFGITATGTKARRNVNGYSTIAVDPRVIPLGTKVYVEGYGLAIAEDTGGAIKGNKIDIYVNSESQAVTWGVRWVNLYVLK
ncbi:3D domain-containing protein [Haloimpatiens sp. FM7315]|uniref:3D domain-containing protein n=1 Tax=Haloimpatiens sp. FM7315 TaxID=3298609 RepID=UPI0035A2BD8D